jgi:putative transposase
VGRYVVLNPVRAGMVGDAVEWTWSSHRAMLGKVAPPPFLDVEWALGQLARKLADAREVYAAFITAGERAIQEARLESRGQAPGQAAPGRAPYD